MFKALMGGNPPSSEVSSASSKPSRRSRDSKSSSSRKSRDDHRDRGLGDLDTYSSPSGRKYGTGESDRGLVTEPDRKAIERAPKDRDRDSKSVRRRERDRSSRDLGQRSRGVDDSDDEFDRETQRRERRRNQPGDPSLPPLDTNVPTSMPGEQFAADLAAPGFSQFPMQYDAMVSGSMPEQPGSRPAFDPHVHQQFPGQFPVQNITMAPGSTPEQPGPSPAFDPHVHQQFPGQFPTSVAEPYRPPNPAGEASEYYGDQGQSVADQPGVRPGRPPVIPNSQAHLMSASPTANPPPEPSSMGQIGAAADYYAGGAGHEQTQPSQLSGAPLNQSNPNQHSLALASTATAGAAAYGVGDAFHDHHDSGSYPGSAGPFNTASTQQPLSSPGKPSHSHGAGTAVGAAAAGAAGAYMLSHHHSSSSEHPPQYAAQDQEHPFYGGAPMHGLNTDPATFGAAAAGAAGLGAAAAHGMHSHGPAAQGPGFQSGGLAFHQRRRGPLGKLVDFWRDPEGVGRFEDYTEAIGVCRYCFEPGTTSRDAPRKHHYHRRRSWDRHSGGSRVGKTSRFTSSEDESRRRRKSKGKSWLPGLLGAYAAKSLFTNKDFGETYSVKSGRVVSSRESLNDSGRLSRTDRRSQTSRAVYRRSRSRDNGSYSDLKRSRHDARKRSRSRSKSSSRSGRRSALRNAALGAASGSAAYTVSKSRHTGSPKKSKSKSGRSSFSSDSSSSDSSSPRRKSVAGGLTAFFTAPSKNRKKPGSEKSKGIFSFNNSSSSSGDADLAFGNGVSRNRAGKSKRKGRSEKDIDAKLLGLGAAATALAGASNRPNLRPAEVLAGKGSRDRPVGYTSTAANDDDWEDLSGEQPASSVASGLAFGGSGDDSQTSDSSASEWGWGWGRKKDKKERRSSSPRNHHTGAKIAASALGGAALASAYRSHTKHSSQDNVSSAGSLQHVVPVPTSDPSKFDAIRDPPGAQPALVRPGPIPLQQPQPVAPVSNALYTSQGVPAYVPPANEQFGIGNVGSYPRNRDRNPRRSDSFPIFGTEPLEGVPAPGVKRRSTTKDQPSVQFDLTDEQAKRERRTSRRESRKRDRDLEGRPQLIDRERAGFKDAERQTRRRREREDRDDDSASQRERRGKDMDSSYGIGPAAIGTIGTAAAATALSGKSAHDDSSESIERRHSEGRERRRAERRRSEPRSGMTAISESAQEDLPTRSADGTRASSARDISSGKPVHDDYAEFFAPEELRRSTEKDGSGHGPASMPRIVEVEPASERFAKAMSQPVEDFLPKDGTTPWPIPSLNLIEPTPPQSVNGSAVGAPSPADDIPTPAAASAEAPHEPKRQSSGSRVTWRDVSWGEHETLEHDVQPGSSEHDSDQDRGGEVGSSSDIRANESERHSAGFGNQVEFAAIVAAATAANGFDPSFVTDDPIYHTRSAPGAEGQRHGFVEGEIEADDEGKGKPGVEHFIEGEPIYAEPETLARKRQAAVDRAPSEFEERAAVDQDVFNMPGGFEPEDSAKESPRDRDSYGAEKGDDRSVFSAPTLAQAEAPSRSTKSRRDSGDLDEADDNTREPADAEGTDGKKTGRKRRSKRDSSDTDSVSVASSPPKIEAAENRRGKDDQDKPKGSGGFLSNIFGSKVSEPAEPRGSPSVEERASREVKSENETGQEESRRQKKRSSRHRSLDDFEQFDQDSDREGDKPESKDDASLESYKSHRQQREEKRRHRYEEQEEYEKARDNNDDSQPFLAEGPEMPKTVDDADEHGASGLATPAAAEAAGLGLDVVEERLWSRSASFPAKEASRPTSPELPLEQQLQGQKSTRPSMVRMSESPTAVPLHFRRPPVSPSANRPSSVSSPALPSPDTPTQPRHRRPTSTEFRHSREIRPLFLVERLGAAKMEAESDESFPSLPSSKPSSRTPSVEDLRASDGRDVRSWETFDLSEQIHGSRRRPDLSISTGEGNFAWPEHDILGSQQTTPTAQTFGEASQRQQTKKEKPTYEFHSPSELLQDPSVYAAMPPSPTLDHLPSAEGSTVGMADENKTASRELSDEPTVGTVSPGTPRASSPSQLIGPEVVPAPTTQPEHVEYEPKDLDADQKATTPAEEFDKTGTEHGVPVENAPEEDFTPSRDEPMESSREIAEELAQPTKQTPSEETAAKGEGSLETSAGTETNETLHPTEPQESTPDVDGMNRHEDYDKAETTAETGPPPFEPEQETADEFHDAVEQAASTEIAPVTEFGSQQENALEAPGPAESISPETAPEVVPEDRETTATNREPEPEPAISRKASKKNKKKNKRKGTAESLTESEPAEAKEPPADEGAVGVQAEPAISTEWPVESEQHGQPEDPAQDIQQDEYAPRFATEANPDFPSADAPPGTTEQPQEVDSLEGWEEQPKKGKKAKKLRKAAEAAAAAGPAAFSETKPGSESEPKLEQPGAAENQGLGTGEAPVVDDGLAAPEGVPNEEAVVRDDAEPVRMETEQQPRLDSAATMPEQPSISASPEQQSPDTETVTETAKELGKGDSTTETGETPQDQTQDQIERTQTASSKKSKKDKKKKRRQSQDLEDLQTLTKSVDETAEPSGAAPGNQGDEREVYPEDRAQEITPAEPSVPEPTEEMQAATSKKNAKKDKKKRKSVSFDLGEGPEQLDERSRDIDVAAPVNESEDEGDVPAQAKPPNAGASEGITESATGEKHPPVDVSMEDAPTYPDEQGENEAAEQASKEGQTSLSFPEATAETDTPMLDLASGDGVQPPPDEMTDVEAPVSDSEKANFSDVAPEALEKTEQIESAPETLTQEGIDKQEADTGAEPNAPQDLYITESQSPTVEDAEPFMSAKEKRKAKKDKKKKRGMSLDLSQETPSAVPEPPTEPEPEPEPEPHGEADNATDQAMPHVKDSEETVPELEWPEKEAKPFMSAKEKRKAKKEKKRQSKSLSPDNDGQNAAASAPDAFTEDSISAEKGPIEDSPRDTSATTEEPFEPSPVTAVPPEEDGKKHQSYDAQSSDDKEEDRFWTDEMKSSQVEQQQEIPPQDAAEQSEADENVVPGGWIESYEWDIGTNEDLPPAPAHVGKVPDDNSPAPANEEIHSEPVEATDEMGKRQEPVDELAADNITSALSEGMPSQPATEDAQGKAEKEATPPAEDAPGADTPKPEAPAIPEEDDWMTTTSSKKRKKKQKQKEKKEKERRPEESLMGVPPADNIEQPPGDLPAADEPVAASGEAGELAAEAGAVEISKESTVPFEEKPLESSQTIDEPATESADLEVPTDPMFPSEEDTFESGQKNDQPATEGAAETTPPEVPEWTRDITHVAENVETQGLSRKMSEKEKKKRRRSLAQESASQAEQEQSAAEGDSPVSTARDNMTVPTSSEFQEGVPIVADSGVTENLLSEGKASGPHDVAQTEPANRPAPAKEEGKSPEASVSDTLEEGNVYERSADADVTEAGQSPMDVTEAPQPGPEIDKVIREAPEEGEYTWPIVSRKKSKKSKKVLAQQAAVASAVQAEESAAIGETTINAGVEEPTTVIQRSDELPQQLSKDMREDARDDEWATTTKKKGKKAKKERQKQKARAEEAEIPAPAETQDEPADVGFTSADEHPATEDVAMASGGQTQEIEPVVSIDPFEVPSQSEEMDVDKPMEPTDGGDTWEMQGEPHSPEGEPASKGDEETQARLLSQAREKDDDLEVAGDLFEDRPKEHHHVAPLSRKLSKKEKRKAKQKALQTGTELGQQPEPEDPGLHEAPTEAREGPSEPEASREIDAPVQASEDPAPGVAMSKDEPDLSRTSSKMQKRKARKASLHVGPEQLEQEENRELVTEQNEQAYADDGHPWEAQPPQQGEVAWRSIEWGEDKDEAPAEHPAEQFLEPEQGIVEPDEGVVGNFDESAIRWVVAKEREPSAEDSWHTSSKKKDKKKRKQGSVEFSAQPMPVGDNSGPVETFEPHERPTSEAVEGAEDTICGKQPTEEPVKQSKVANAFPGLERGSFRRQGSKTSQGASHDDAIQLSEAPIAITEHESGYGPGENEFGKRQSTTTAPEPFTYQPTTREIAAPEHRSTLSPFSRAAEGPMISENPSPGLHRTPSVHGKHHLSSRLWRSEASAIQGKRASTPPRSLFGGPIGGDGDADSPPRTPLGTIAEQEPEGRVEKAGERSMAPGSGTPQLDVRSEHLLPRPQTPVREFTDDSLDRKRWPTPDKGRSVEMEGGFGGEDELGGVQKRSQDSRSTTSSFDKELASTPTLRPSPGGAGGSGEKQGPLRRTTRAADGDLRGVTRGQESTTPTGDPQPPHLPSPPPPRPTDLNLEQLPSSSAYDPITDKGKRPVRGMADVYEAWGETPTSPRSPNRPPSVRHRRSMQHLQDLESRLDQLVSENRLLVAAREEAENKLQNVSLARRKSDKALNTRDVDLRDKEAELEQLRNSVDWFKKEVTRLTHENEGLTAAASSLTAAHAQELPGAREVSTRELDDMRFQYDQLSGSVEDRVRQEVGTALADKNAEIRRLHEELETTRDKVRELQQQIATSMQDDILVFRDEDYFDGACQRLCGHVQQWVLRFSKHSDHHRCRRIGDLHDEKVADRFDNAILDGSDADAYLADRVRRRDVFMSVVMTMIWEYIFTRYLFGMDRDQRQKLKSLEKQLGEVGTRSAVHRWRATTLTLLARRSAFARQRESDTEAVALEIFGTLSRLLPPPTNAEPQLLDSLRKVLHVAVNLSIEMRCQLAEYIMLPPLQPEYDTNGDLMRHVYFNASLMNERSGETTSNEELETQQSVVRIVLFPLVVKKGSDTGEGEDEIVVCPAQVLVARPGKDKALSHSTNRSVHSVAPPSAVDLSNMI